MPDGFPMPIRDPDEVSGVSWMQLGGQVTYDVRLQVSPTDMEELLALYEGWMRDRGLEVTMAPDSVLGTDGDVIALVAATDYGGYWEVGLSWSGPTPWTSGSAARRRGRRLPERGGSGPPRRWCDRRGGRGVARWGGGPRPCLLGWDVAERRVGDPGGGGGGEAG